jgi:methylmalonyl-CoA/ethylmalonyl-CoA epimerase
LHHLCFRVDDVPACMASLPNHGLASRDPAPRRGTKGKQAAFLDPSTTRGVLFEVTG